MTGKDNKKRDLRSIGFVVLLLPILGLVVGFWVWQRNGGLYWETVTQGRGIVASILRYRTAEGKLPPNLGSLHPRYHGRDLTHSLWHFYSEGDQFWLSSRSHFRHSVTYVSGSGWWLNLDDGTPSTLLIPRVEPGDKPLELP